jgi:hypothetical protein
MRKLILCFVLTSIISYGQKPAVTKSAVRPDWGPISSSYFRYYYLPDIDSYYDIEKSNFISAKNGKWLAQKTLPARYKNYNLYNGYKVIINDYNGNEPYKDHKSHLARYPKENKGKIQKTSQTVNASATASTAKVLTREEGAQKSTPSIPATKRQ